MSKLKVDTIANSADNASTPIADVINGSARAWVNFGGTGTVAIRAAYNVSSITDNGVGYYTVNFTTAMPDSNFSVVSTAEWTSVVGVDSLTTSSVRVRVRSVAAADIDSNTVSASIFR